MRSRSVSVLLLAALAAACSSSSSAPSAPPRMSEAELEARVAEGRALLDAGKPAEAELVFAEAAARDGESLRTRMWVLRAWMDQRRSNDTLDALDALDRAGEAGADMDYLYGMAFARRAEGYLADGVADSSVRMNFIDAAQRLGNATRVDPARYRDAFLPLANAAFYEGDVETARAAVERAVAVAPASAEAWLLRGRVAMAEFGPLEAERPGSPEAEALWSTAVESFGNAVERSGAPDDERGQATLASAALQLGHTLLWRAKTAEATDAYATAIAYDPLGFPFAQANEALQGAAPAPDDERPIGFRKALELGRERLEARVGAGDPREGTLLWWLGWTRFVDADWSGAEEAFQGALARGDAYANGWFYVGLARQYRKDSEGAVAAMRAGWAADPASMVAVAASAGGSQRAFENLLGWCATQEPPRNLDAAFLAEMLAEAMPNDARHWNNLGLFLRDEGERLEIDAHQKKTPEPDAALLADLYERSLAAYERALELTPDDPQLLNDTALMLIYHVGPDFPRAEAMFGRAIELIDQRLARPDLSEEDRARFEQSRKDAEENLAAMKEHFAKGEAEDGAAEVEAGAPANEPRGDSGGGAAAESGDGA